MTVSRSCQRERIGDLRDTCIERARTAVAGAKARHGLTEAKLRELQPGERTYKVIDGGNGLYVVVTPSGSRSFRYDYRLSGRRDTLTIGRHEPVARHAKRSHLAYGMDVTLEEASLLLARARVDVSSGRSPARAKVEQRSAAKSPTPLALGDGRRGTSSSSPTPRAAPSGWPTAHCYCGVRSTTASWLVRSGN